MCKHMKKMKCNAWKEKEKTSKEKKRKAMQKKRKRKKNDEWGTKCLDQFCGIKWATQWKLRVENAQSKS